MIRVVEDVVAPGVVVGVDILTLEVAPDWNEVASYIMAGIGYGGAALRLGGQFVNNVAHAALPLAVRNIYARVKAAQPASQRAGAGAQRLALRNRSSQGGPVNRQYQPEFAGAGSHAI